MSAPPVPGPAEPAWTRAELAWPLALFAGFSGTWVGLSTGLPGLAPLLAAALVAPLALALANRRVPERAFAALVGCAVGAAGAVVGTVFEAGFDAVSEALLGARGLRAELARILGPEARAEPLGLLARHGLPLALGLLFARPTRGIAPTLASLVGIGAGAAAASERAVAVGVAGGDRFQALFLAWPPGNLLEALALLAFAAVAMRPPGLPGPRRLLHLAVAAAALAVGAWALAEPWGQLVAGAVG